MSDTKTTTETIVETSQPTAQVSSVTNSKPYDDDMLEAYESEATTEGDNKDQEQTDSAATDKDIIKKSEDKAPEDKDEDSEKESKPGDEEAEEPKPEKVPDNVEDVAVKRSINGKEVEFKVKDAIQAYVKQEEFNRNMDRRISLQNQKERAWQKEEQDFTSRVMEVVEKAQNGDFVSGIRALAKLAAGKSELDIVKFEKMYFDQLDKVNEIYTKMTPEQRDAFFAKRSAAEAKAEAEKLRQEKAMTEAQSQLQTQVNQLMEQHKLPPEEFWGGYKTLADEQVGEGKPFSHPNEITAQDVVEYALSVRNWEKVYKAGESVGITDESILDEVGKLTASHPDFTTEDIVQMIKDAGLASPKAVENLNRKVGKNRQPNSTASSTKNKNGKIEGIDDEDLSFLYRNQPKSYQRIVR